MRLPQALWAMVGEGPGTCGEESLAVTGWVFLCLMCLGPESVPLSVFLGGSPRSLVFCFLLIERGSLLCRCVLLRVPTHPGAFLYGMCPSVCPLSWMVSLEGVSV